MLNERGYERETNCSGMLKTSCKLQRAQRVHRACRMRIHANEVCNCMARHAQIILVYNTTVLQV